MNVETGKVVSDGLTEVPVGVCGYPLPGWRLEAITHDATQSKQGWIVTLQTEGAGPWQTAMARSEVGLLEAWDEAIVIAKKVVRPKIRDLDREEPQLLTSTLFIKRMRQMKSALQECESYFEERADAEYFTDSPDPCGNAEMRLLMEVRDALLNAPKAVLDPIEGA